MRSQSRVCLGDAVEVCMHCTESDEREAACKADEACQERYEEGVILAVVAAAAMDRAIRAAFASGGRHQHFIAVGHAKR